MLKLLVLLSIVLSVYTLSYTGVLKVGEQGQGKNPLFFSVSGNCKINSGTATLDFKIISGWAKIDGHKYSSGNTGTISVKAGQSFSGEVGGHAEGWGKNAGPDDINFTCDGSLGESFTLLEQGIDLSELISETVTIAVGTNATYRNPLFFGVSATCAATTTATDTMYVHDISGTLRANNYDLTSGKTQNIQISNGENLNLYCSGHAEAQLENTGPAPITLQCSVNLAAEYIKYMLAKTE